MSFSELGLTEDVLKAVADAGYTEPTPIQKQAIPIVLMGRDILGCAQTGTGKTASFTLPMIDILASGRAKARMPRTLILEPTRELAAQVADNFETYGKYNKLSMALLIGGTSMEEQVSKLDRGVDVLIATPGRLLDLFSRGGLLLNDTKLLVIDEADRMLDMGFIPDVEKIVSLLPKIRQTLFFSATMPPAIRKLADMFLMNPKEITVAAQSSAAKTVVQGLYKLKGGGMGGHVQWRKRTVLRKMLRHEDLKNAIVFCNRKRDVGIVHRSLDRHGFNVGQLHGDMVQSLRMETLDKFKNGEIAILVCSDVAARGIDIKAMSHVFNYDVPTHSEDYVHRIGRTGRAGLEGHAFTIATDDDTKYLASISRLIGKDIPLLDLKELMGDEYEEVANAEDASHSRGGRERGKGGRDRGERSGRNRSSRNNSGERSRSDRENTPLSEAKTAEPIAAVPSKESRREEKPREERPSYRDNKRPPRDNHENRYRRNGRDDDDGPDLKIKGFGSAIPAFLQKSVEISFDTDSGDNDEIPVKTETSKPRTPRKPRPQAKTKTVPIAEEQELPNMKPETGAETTVEAKTEAAIPDATPESMNMRTSGTPAQGTVETVKPKAKAAKATKARTSRAKTTEAKAATPRKPRKTKAEKEAEALALAEKTPNTVEASEPEAKPKKTVKQPKPTTKTKTVRKPRKTKAQKEAEALAAELAKAENQNGAAPLTAEE